jgi:5,10-methenyltetrahydromethanopterin hydrogenase
MQEAAADALVDMLPAPAPAGFYLFVDCYPLGADVTHAEEIFSRVKERIYETHKVADYRYVQYTGAAVFQETLQNLVDEGQVYGNVAVNSRTPEGQLSLAILLPAARFPVVRGVS